ncbi:YeiH family protein [Phreatobacter stygius]|uniref:Putative sulfate exporter family transporter n=1 Tax=Phreatobacter stygius TaxID=1940610 RepID=A0A4D7AZ62_9HYPH|nr:putative sulfate exporter family transporter [Phreatobacter stygius]QCI66639.1 putative sulfate exporter family transporter [Phreatobacter stygius]
MTLVSPAAARPLLPGMALASAVSIIAVMAEPVVRNATGGRLALPGMVIALIIGIALHSVAARPAFEAGLTFAVKKLLRWAIGLLGLRVALGDIIGLGLGTLVLVVGAMAATIAAGIWLARRFGAHDGYGALAGAATAVCGASAALATTTVLPHYKARAADTAFTVVAANAVSTIVMLIYPPLAILLGFDASKTGILLGATIHDMAQVVGAGYAVSDPVGNTAVVVKLFRVFLLLPVVLAIGWWFMRQGEATHDAKVPVPVFALVFLALVVVNSIVPTIPALVSPYALVKGWLVALSNAGLLIAIAALGLGTSITAILSIGWRHVAVFFGTTLVILGIVIAGLLVL